MVLRLCLLLSLSCLLLPAGGAAESRRVELFYGIAQGNYLIGDLRGAASGVEETLRIEPDFLPALKLKTRVRLDLGDGEAALEAAERAIALAPDDLEALNLKALVLARDGKREAALEQLEAVRARAAPDSPDFATASRLLGLLRMADGDWQAAAEAFEKSFEAAPRTEASRVLAAEAYLEQARSATEARNRSEAFSAVDRAIALYREAQGQEAFRELNRLQLLRARMHARAGDSAAAIEDLQALLARTPEDLEARITLASVYAADERWESLTGLIDPLAEEPSLADVYHLFAGRLALARDRVGSARAHFEAALEALPEGPAQLRASLQFYRALCLRRLGRTEEADAVFQESIENGFRPESLGEAVEAARLLLASGRAEEAVSMLQALTLNRTGASAEAWTLLGRAHRASGAVPFALSAFTQSLEIDSAQPDTLALRGALLRGLGDLEGAAADFEAALAHEPDLPAVVYALGLVRVQAGLLPEARDSFEQAASLDPENPGPRLLHALLAYTTGRFDPAEDALDKYFELVEDRPNPTAIYLRYALYARADTERALAYLASRADSPEVLLYRRYCGGGASRAELLDHAGVAEDPRAARAQICEAAFWMSQHERHAGNPAAEAELLKIAVDDGEPEFVEYQCARWLSLP